ncbi:FISUMP domain-containing protein [Odoribacter lunatus]|uniref:FISUMP domain-containing protein n=1 Tax=Odoribacter lunatus TaxID=2941335 RepID=UPI002041F415|nr:FISUMP domain-containing protein [Odoribacter lunatus]
MNFLLCHIPIHIIKNKILFLWCIFLFFEQTAVSQEKIGFRACPGVLMDGVCWAKYNVDEPGHFANPANPNGMYYQWNRRKGWSATGSFSEWDSSPDPSDTWEAANDPCPAGWRMPTVEEVNRLIKISENYNSTHFDNKILIDRVTRNTIDLPCNTGFIYESGRYYALGQTFYWLNSSRYALELDNSHGALQLKVYSQNAALGFPVRCVADETACDIVLTTSEVICEKDLPYRWRDTVFREGTRTGEFYFRRTCKETGCDSTVYLYLTVDTVCHIPCPGLWINGVCWARSNVDKPGTFASTPESYGMYYQWNRKKGWPAEKPGAEWDNTSAPGERWESENDPCPAGWRVPTAEEMGSLNSGKVTSISTQRNGVEGIEFTYVTTGTSLFFPLSTCLTSWGTGAAGDGHYWSGSSSGNGRARSLVVGRYNLADLEDFSNDIGSTVRCVADENVPTCADVVTDTSVTICTKDLPYEWRDTIFDVGTKSGVYRFQRISTVTGCDSIVNLHLSVCPGEWINGVCWARSNVDEPGTFAATPEASGMLYQWNRRKGWPATGEVSGWDSSVPSGESWEAANDPCPAGWRVPTAEEIDALLDDVKVNSIWTLQNGVNGRKFTDNTTGNTIFLPSVRYRDGNHEKIPSEHEGWYWSDMRSAEMLAKILFFKHDYFSDVNFLTIYGLSVRCVADLKCDTIITDTSVTVCAKDLPYEWGDTIFDVGTVSGDYRFQRISTVTGCDSIVNLHLTVDKCEKPCPGVLINEVCWAKYNVDEPGRFANPGKPYGMLYQWNRKKGWPAMTPESVSGWASSLEPGDTWEPANDPCPVGWRMPTAEEMEKLFDKTKVSSIETARDRVLSTRYTDIATGNMIFLPHANYRDEHGVTHITQRKEYWSGSNHWALWDNVFFQQRPYADGYSVRCVADENACDIVLTASENICKETLPYTWHDTTFREGTVTGEYCIRRTNPASGCDSIFYLYLTVDTLCGKPCKERGVFINGVCWAESNVDNPNTFADTPEAFGLLYQWNRKKGHPLKGYLNHWSYNSSKDSRWEAINNPCPADWRIPTIGEMFTLFDDLNVEYEWTQQNGVNGMRFTDKTSGNTIFMPAAGSRSFPVDYGTFTTMGEYWSTTRVYNNEAAYLLTFPDIESKFTYGGDGAYSVRCVAGRDTTGCGSTVTDTSVTVCTKDLPYEWGDTTFDVGTVSGDYRFQCISTITGCDSIVNLHLTIQQSFDTTLYDTVSQGDSYYKHGLNLAAVTGSLTHTQPLHTIHGCDSTVTLNLHVWPKYFNSQTKDICAGDTFDFRGRKLYKSGVYYDSLKTVHGCDSVFSMTLKVHPVYGFSFSGAVCSGSPYSNYGFSLPAVYRDTIVRDSFKTRWGCDSLRTLYLTVHPVYDTILYDTVCQGDAYYKHGLNLAAVTESLTHPQPLHTIHGCDSNVTLNLHVWPKYLYTYTKDVCERDTFDFRGRKLYENGVYYDSLKTVHGCDSVFSMTLEVHPVYDSSFSGAVCFGSPYNNYGFSLPAVYRDTIVRDSFKTRWGCDSLRTLYLTVHPVYDTTFYDTICRGEGYYLHGFSLPEGTLGGSFTQNHLSVHGCDSTVTLNLHVWPKYLYTYAKDICSGDTVDFRGRKLYKSGVYYDSLSTVHGCDSVYRMTLTVHPIPRPYFQDVVCYGSSYDKYGVRLPAVYRDTVIRDTFQSVWKCDSIRTLYLAVQPVYNTPLYDTVCQGDGYYKHGFSLSSVQADREDSLTLFSRAGCDSVLTLHLKVHPVYNTILYDSVCPSARYVRHGFQLSDIRETGTYRRRLRSVHGCDSLVTLELYVYPTYFYPRTENICEGDTFDFRGRRLYESGTYYDSLTTVHGCDSVYCLYLTVHPVYDVRLSGILCEGTTYNQYGFSVTTPGEHYLYLKTIARCDSTVLLTLTEEKKIEGAIGLSLEDCSLHGYAFFFNPVVPQSAWLWDMGDGKVFRSEEGYHTYANSGLYRIQLRLETSGGCENLYSYVQYVPPYFPEIPIRANRLLIDEDYPTVHFRVDVLPGMRCEWDFGDGVTGVGDSVSHTYDAHSEKYYDVWLKVFNADSCVTESRAQIEVAFFPKTLNTFSPNGDGINDVFMGDYRIEIINRNGLRIYTGENGWDGTYKGSPAPADTYFYRLYYRTALGERMKTGYVTLIR